MKGKGKLSPITDKSLRQHLLVECYPEPLYLKVGMPVPFLPVLYPKFHASYRFDARGTDSRYP